MPVAPSTSTSAPTSGSGSAFGGKGGPAKGGKGKKKPAMANYDVADAEDLKDAALEARAVKVTFDRKDVKAWFQRLEIRLEFAGVRSQWLKRCALRTSYLKTWHTPAMNTSSSPKLRQGQIFIKHSPGSGLSAAWLFAI